jgi:hypothetical protein
MPVRKVLKIAIYALFLIFPPLAQAAEDPVGSFERLIRDATITTNTSTPVYFNDSVKAWAKRQFSVTDVNYDVKTTESLVAPIVGTVTFQLVIVQSDFYPTAEEAEAATTFNLKTSENTSLITLNFSYRRDTWQFSNGVYERIGGFLAGEKSDISALLRDYEPTSNPNVAILLWLPK